VDTRILSVGVIGAGRVGAVIAAALRSVGYRIAAAAGESDASRTRIETLLPGVPIDKPTAVARSCDLLLLTVPDDALDNVVRMLVVEILESVGHEVVGAEKTRAVALLAREAAVKVAVDDAVQIDALSKAAVAAETGRPAQEVIEAFGVALVPGLLEIYGFLINPRWSFMDFLLNTEGVVHRGVRLNSPYAQPPALQTERAGPDSVAITYRSKRALCSLAKGIVRGAAAHYRVEITIAEERCMLRGDPECLITVSEGYV